MGARTFRDLRETGPRIGPATRKVEMGASRNVTYRGSLASKYLENLLENDAP